MKVSKDYLDSLPKNVRSYVARRIRRRVGNLGVMYRERVVYSSPKISVAKGYEDMPLVDLAPTGNMDIGDYENEFVNFIVQKLQLMLGRDYLYPFPEGMIMEEREVGFPNGKQVIYDVKYNELSDPVGKVTITWEHGKIIHVSGVMVGVYVLLHQLGYTGA